MSYGLTCKCSKCIKKAGCIDSSLVQSAINGIHYVNYANGVQNHKHHLGAGWIEINCLNFVDENPPQLEETSK